MKLQGEKSRNPLATRCDPRTHGSTQSARAERSLERVERDRSSRARPPLPAFYGPLTHAHEVWR